MKHFTRIITVLAASAVLVAPAVAGAATSIYSGPNGFSYSSGDFSFAVGSGTTGATCANTLCTIGFSILYIINNVLVPLIFAFAFFIFLWGVFKAYIWSRGDDAEVTKGHHFIWWGIIGFAVMISVWGIVNVVTNTFGLAGYSAPPTPVSYPTQ